MPVDEQDANFEPFCRPAGAPRCGIGVLGAAASIFFAYVGFDAVSTAAEETKNPKRNIPIGLIGSLAVCTVFYLLVATARSAPRRPAGVRATVAAAPGARTRRPLQAGRRPALVCSRKPLAYVLREIGHPMVGNCVGLRRVHRPALGHPDDDLRPDAHLLHDGARRPAAAESCARCTRASTRRTSSR